MHYDVGRAHAAEGGRDGLDPRDQQADEPRHGGDGRRGRLPLPDLRARLDRRRRGTAVFEVAPRSLRSLVPGRGAVSRDASDRPQSLTADVRVRLPGLLHAGAPAGAACSCSGRPSRCWRCSGAERGRRPGAIAWAARRLRLLDADGVLAAPDRLPLRARQRLRAPDALHDPRRPPRPPERPAAARDAAVGVDPAGRASSCSASGSSSARGGWQAFGAGFLAGYLFYDMLHYHVHHHVPTTACGPAAARAAHAPSLPGRRPRVRRQRPGGTTCSVPRRTLPHEASTPCVMSAGVVIEDCRADVNETRRSRGRRRAARSSRPPSADAPSRRRAGAARCRSPTGRSPRWPPPGSSPAPPPSRSSHRAQGRAKRGRRTAQEEATAVRRGRRRANSFLVDVHLLRRD